MRLDRRAGGIRGGDRNSCRDARRVAVGDGGHVLACNAADAEGVAAEADHFIRDKLGVELGGNAGSRPGFVLLPVKRGGGGSGDAGNDSQQAVHVRGRQASTQAIVLRVVLPERGVEDDGIVRRGGGSERDSNPGCGVSRENSGGFTDRGEGKRGGRGNRADNAGTLDSVRIHPENRHSGAGFREEKRAGACDRGAAGGVGDRSRQVGTHTQTGDAESHCRCRRHAAREITGDADVFDEGGVGGVEFDRGAVPGEKAGGELRLGDGQVGPDIRQGGGIQGLCRERNADWVWGKSRHRDLVYFALRPKIYLRFIFFAALSFFYATGEDGLRVTCHARHALPWLHGDAEIANAIHKILPFRFNSCT